MLQSHERFYTQDGKRLVLVVDDEMINREILRNILDTQFDVITAEDGEEALEIIRRNRTVLSAVLLDLMMPKISGMELLKIIQEDESLHHLPTIVLTSELEAEVESLNLGASDFIKKPFDEPEVILARVQRTIELGEDRNIIMNTERDELTGLLNKEFFYRYSEQYNLHHPGRAMDAIVLDINNFHLVNEMWGRQYGDQVLKAIGKKLMSVVDTTGGVAGRGDADTFMLYLPIGTNFDNLHHQITDSLAEEHPDAPIRMRMGVYRDVDRAAEVEQYFDRAKIAGNTLRGNYTQFISYYDSELYQKELLAQRLIDDIAVAIRDKQIQVYYQPKFDVTGERPVLSSAEALVRWRHPYYGMVSPGIFIPIFEENGLIQTLDHYVLREAVAQMKDWKERLGAMIPVSVNFSRIDMYDPNLLSFLTRTVDEAGLAREDLFVEITETAYAEDAEQLVSVVNRMRAEGFQVEMDDFGTGYSSLHMLAEMPVDVLKLDMQFVHNMHNNEKNLRMVELVMEIARHLGVLVVAEGVETQQQLEELTRMGCHRIQGKYFGMPIPAEAFERMIVEELKK